MKLDKAIKSCLVITYGPVPTPQYQTVEGGGMRAWGLAKGLLANGVQATVAVNNSFPQDHKEHDGVELVNWGLDDSFADFLNSFDAVLISYNMGDASVFVVDRIADNVQLILDAYVPIYVEVSAREAKDMGTEMKNYMADLGRFNHALKRGDYFLCASSAQKVFYTGVLSALGIINPRSYREGRIIIAPFGIHDTKAKAQENPYPALGIKENDFVVLWFGGLYPWFRVEELLGAIEKLQKYSNIKFVFVGGKNPFNPNPDFSRQYDRTVEFAKQKKYIDKSVFFIDWVDYEKRTDWYKGADVVISLNQPGEENGLSWRTRVMDFVWGELAMITNGGDPLSEDLLQNKAAIRLSELSSAAIADTIYATYSNREALKTTQKQVIAQQKRYQWPVIMTPVASIVKQASLPYMNEQEFLSKNYIAVPQEQDNPIIASALPEHPAKHIYRISKKAIAYGRKKGLKRSVKVALSIAKNAAKTKTQPKKKKYVFISHPINFTGAPLVLIDIVKEYAKKYGVSNTHLVAPGILPEQQKGLRKLGIKLDKAALGIGFRIIDLQLGLRKDDFLLINTAAIYENYRNYIIHALETGKLNHAYWFIHEDITQLAVVAQEIVNNKDLLSRIQKLVKQEKLTILVPAQRVKTDYDAFFRTNKVRVTRLRIDVPKEYTKPRKASDYETVDFLLSGTASDGRKGQLIAVSAFYSYIKNYSEKNSANYRKFKLHLVAIGDDYISQQIKSIGKSLLGDRLVIYPTLPREEALEVTRDCNAVICCSLNETFGLYVAEGMLMNHVVLRNDSAGVDEQLDEGRNGYRINSQDVEQFATTIAKVLDKKLSNTDLQTMGNRSREMMLDYSSGSYIEKIEG